MRRTPALHPHGFTALICALALLALSPLLRADFLFNWDDATYVVNNPDVAHFSLATIQKVFSTFYLGNYQPLTMMTYMVDRALFDLNPSGFHLINLLLHLLNTVLVMIFMERLTGDRWVTRVSGLLFAIHPLHVESVAWISERKDLVYSAFYLAALAAYVRYVSSGLRARHLGWAFGLFVLSCLSKPMAVSLPVVMFLLDRYLGRKADLRSLLEKIPFFLVAIATGVIALQSQGESAIGIAPEFPLIQRLFLVCFAIDWYILKLFAPLNLSAIYYYPVVSGSGLPIYIYLAPLLPALLIYLGWKVAVLRRAVAFGLGFFLITIAPVLQLVPSGDSLVADRYTYVPFLGLFLMVGEGLRIFASHHPLRRSVGYAAVILVGLGMAWLSYQRAWVWQNGVRLFENVVEMRPSAHHAYVLLGNAYRHYGSVESAIAAYDQAIGLKPDYTTAYINRGTSAFGLGSYEAAVSDFSKAVELDPAVANVWFNRGAARLKLRQYDLAIEDFTKAVEIDPQYALPYFGLGDAYGTGRGEYDKALESYQRGLQYGPESPGILHNMGIALYQLGRQTEACATWRRASGMGSALAERALAAYCEDRP